MAALLKINTSLLHSDRGLSTIPRNPQGLLFQKTVVVSEIESLLAKAKPLTRKTYVGEDSDDVSA